LIVLKVIITFQTYVLPVLLEVTVEIILGLYVLRVNTCHLKDSASVLNVQPKLCVLQQVYLHILNAQLIRNGHHQAQLLVIHVLQTMNALLAILFLVLEVHIRMQMILSAIFVLQVNHVLQVMLMFKLIVAQELILRLDQWSALVVQQDICVQILKCQSQFLVGQVNIKAQQVRLLAVLVQMEHFRILMELLLVVLCRLDITQEVSKELLYLVQ
jgi:hypothetical protein